MMQKNTQRHLYVAGFVVLSLLTLAAVTRGQEKTSDPALRVAVALDKMIQPRFLEEMGRFGMSRSAPVTPGHEGTGFYYDSPVREIRPRDPDETRFWKAAETENRDYVIAFLRMNKRPGHFVRDKRHNERVVQMTERRIQENKDATPHLFPLGVRDSRRQLYLGNETNRETMARYENDKTEGMHPLRQAAQNETEVRRFEKTAVAALPALRRGESVNTRQNDGWFLAMRPIRAAQESCISCHKGAKNGETLGVMVYAVRTESNP